MVAFLYLTSRNPVTRMRFGCEFYTLQDPKWADAYLDYNTLKQILKQSRFEGDRHGGALSASH